MIIINREATQGTLGGQQVSQGQLTNVAPTANKPGTTGGGTTIPGGATEVQPERPNSQFGKLVLGILALAGIVAATWYLLKTVK